MGDDCVSNYFLKDFYEMGGEGHWSVVFGLGSVSPFVDWRDYCLLQYGWDDAGVQGASPDLVEGAC